MINLVSRIYSTQQQGFLRSSAALLFGLLLLLVSQFSYSALSVSIDNIAYMSSTQIPGPVPAQVQVSATLEDFNNATLDFDQTEVALEEGVITPLLLTIMNTGVNDLNNGSIILTFPVGVNPTFPVNPLYTVVQLPDDTWLVTFINPLIVGQSIDIDMLLGVTLGTPPGIFTIDAELLANGASISTKSINAMIGNVAAGLFLTHQVDKSVVEADEVVTYTLNLTNQLAVSINDILLSNILPSGVRLINGTVKINQIPADNPALSADGRNLVFDIGTLAANETVIITYSAYVSGVAKTGELLSTSIAQGDVSTSNDASVVIILRKDAINIDSHVVGRVLIDSCTDDQTEAVGDLSMRLRSELIDDYILYTVIISGEGVPIEDFRLRINLPEALNYIPFTSWLDKNFLPNPKQKDRQLTFELGDLEASWEHQVQFKVKPDKEQVGLYETSAYADYFVKDQGKQRSPTLTNTYKAEFQDKNYRTFTYWPRFKTLDARLQKEDMVNLDGLRDALEGEVVNHITVIGHSDSSPIRGGGLLRYADNFVLSNARAQSIANYLEKVLNIDAGKITVEGKGDTEPVADNDTPEGRQQNRRVEMLIEVLNNNSYRRSNVILGEESFVEGGVYRQTIFINSGENSESKGMENIRIIMEDGRYVDTDEEGRYHFEGLQSGTHVIQLDPLSIPKGYVPYLCENHTRFAGTPSSRFIDLQQGLIWRANFHLRSVKDITRFDTGLQLKSTLRQNQLHYKALIRGTAEADAAIYLLFSMPDKITLDQDSIYVDDKKARAINENGIWRVKLPAKEKNWDHMVTFDAKLDASVLGEYITSAQLRIDYSEDDVQVGSQVSNIVKVGKSTTKIERYDFSTHFKEASSEMVKADKVALNDIAFLLKNKEIEKIEMVGYTDDRLLFDAEKTHEHLSKLRAEIMADYLVKKIHLPREKLEVIGKGSEDAIDSNLTVEGRAKNRRIEIYVHTKVKNSSVVSTLVKPDSIHQLDTLNFIEKADTDYVEKIAVSSVVPEGILSLKEGDVLAGEFGSVRLSLDSRLNQELYVDGKKVPETRIGFRSTDPSTKKTVYTYFGVNFGEPGEHKMVLKGLDPFGNARVNQEIVYYRSGEIKHIRFIGADNNTADGKTPIIAKIELLDEHGKKINASAGLRIVEGELEPFSEQGMQKVPLVKDASRMVNVDKDGVIKFKPVNKSGLYRVKLQYNNVETIVKIYVKPEIRDWVMVGLADGVVGYHDVSGNSQSLDSNNIEENYYDDGKLAFYAKGRVLGKYLLTVAYDSSKEKTEDDRLMQMIDPNEYYTLYGDGTEQQYDAASKEKLYVRLDGDKFYTLFGDYNTDLTVTELSRYARSFTGAKAVYESEHVSVNAFAASTSQTFTRDEILGDGTSGLYFLSKKNIVINSEKITLQVRDRFHSERIISEQSLNRFADYNLDYQSGSLYFKQPIQRHDENFNPIFIVVDYESHGTGKEDIIAGGRAAIKLVDERVEVGVTHIDEGAQGAEAKLSGVDARFAITKELEFKTEYATTETTQLATFNEGDAYLAELMHRGEKIESSVYLREQEAGFGLGQLNQSEMGTRKYGAQSTAVLMEDLKLHGDIGHEDNLTNNASRNLMLSNIVYSPNDWEFNVGATIADDKDLNGDNFQSELLNTGVSRKLLDDRLRLYTRSDWQLNTGDNNLDYPERHIIGTDYFITDDINIYSEYEYAFSDVLQSETTRVGLRTQPWENATMHNGVQRDVNDAQARTFSVFGLTQAVPFADNWRASFSYDETRTIDKKIYDRVNNNVPLSSGSTNTFVSTNGVADEDFWASTAGLGYQSSLYLFDSRIEYREADTQNKYGIFTGWQRNLLDGIGHALRWQGFITEDDIADDQLDTQLRYSLVVRPLGSDVFWFNRTELKHLDIDGAFSASQTNKFVEHLAINYVPNIDWQIATHIGYKLTKTDLGSDVFTTNTYLLGNETRYDLTPKWDIGGHYHIITTPEVGVTEDSYGFSVGVDLAKNLWLSMGYNIEGYSDDDFNANGYTAQGPFLKLRFKFDQDTFNLND